MADASQHLRGIKATSASVAVSLPSDGGVEGGGGTSQESAAVTFPVVLQAVQDQLAELPGRTRLSGRVEIERNGKEKNLYIYGIYPFCMSLS